MGLELRREVIVDRSPVARGLAVLLLPSALVIANLGGAETEERPACVTTGAHQLVAHLEQDIRVIDQRIDYAEHADFETITIRNQFLLELRRERIHKLVRLSGVELAAAQCLSPIDNTKLALELIVHEHDDHRDEQAPTLTPTTRAGIYAAQSDIQACFDEWTERIESDGNARPLYAEMSVQLSLTAAGIAHSANATGPSSPSLLVCVETALDRIRYAVTSPLELEIQISWDEGVLATTAQVR